MKALAAVFCLVLAAPISASLPDKKLLNISHPRLNPQELDYFGGTIVTTPVWLAVAKTRGEPTYYSNDRGQVKVFKIDFQPPATLTTHLVTLSNPNLGGGSEYGAAMAMQGDWLLIGAPDNAENYQGLQGKVYLYDLATNPEEVSLVFTSPVNEGFERFGRAVGISSTRVAISGLGINTAASATGIVHVYDRGGATPTVPIFSIPNPSPGPNESFGKALLLQGNRLVVSDPGEDGGKGQVWVYDLASATPTVPTLVIPSPMGATESEHFGHCLAMDGDRLAVGAPEGLGANGRAYVFDLGSATPAVPMQSYENPEPFIWEAFGTSVAIRGTQLVIGCPSDDSDMGFRGCVYHYDLAGATPGVPLRKITPPQGFQYGESFGYAVAFGIQADDLIIGSPGNDRVAPNAGDAYRFTLNGASAPTYHGFYNSVQPAEAYGDVFDMDGDRMVGVCDGVLYVHDLAGGSPQLPYLSMMSPDPYGGEKLGGSVAIHGSLVVVGVLNDTLHYPRTDKVYVYDLTLGNHPPVASFGSEPSFGTSVDVHGTKIAIGCPTAGYVDIYDLASPTPSVRLHRLSYYFGMGKHVSMSGSLVAVSESSLQTRVYDLDSATPTVPWRILPYGGLSLSLSGRKLLVGMNEQALLFDLDTVVSGMPTATLSNPDPSKYVFGPQVSLSGNRAYVAAHFSPPWSAGENIVAYGYDISSPAPLAPVTVLTHDEAQPLPMRRTLSQSGDRVMVQVSYPEADNYVRGTINLYVISEPEISVERPEGVIITSPHVFPLGYVGFSGPYYDPGAPISVPVVLTVRNLGGDPLHISGLSRSGTWQESVHLMSSASLPITIPAGGSHTFTAATFENVTGLGSIDASLRLHSNDADEGVFQVSFQGTAIMPHEFWRQQHFNTLENQGDAADAADPDGDGQSNFDEFMAGTSPVDSRSKLQVEIMDHPTIPGQKNIQITPFNNGRVFTLQANDDLSPTGWTTLWTGSASAPELMPRSDPGAVGKSRRFYRVSATRFDY